MAAPEQSSSGVPQFLTKLWLLVEDSGTNHLIRWGQDGGSFLVLDQPKFAKEVLPQFFKHNNMASFVRQLNMYGFRKKANIDQGALKSVREDVEFVHPHFNKGQPAQLELIKRKVSTKDDPKLKHEEVHKILNDVKGMKSKQQDINGTLDAMKRENQALWSEVMMLRQRHDKQQKIVNRLIQFLLTLVNPVGMKRKQPLAIEGGGGSSTSGPSRPPKYSKQISLHSNLDDLINLQTGANLESLQGATLSDITENAAGGGGATVSEVTSPVSPPTAGAFPGQSQQQQLQQDQMTSTQAGIPAPAMSTVDSSLKLQTQPPAEAEGNIPSTMLVSDILTPNTLRTVPGLGDIANMPISEILTQDTPPASTSVTSEPIITSPTSVTSQSGFGQDGIGMLSPLSGLMADNEDASKQTTTSLELIPKDTNGGQPQRSSILQRALSTEEIEQKEQLGSDISTLQANIDSIQSLLGGGNPYLAVDPDLLLGVFGQGGDQGVAGLFDAGVDPYGGDFNPANITGTEMIEYNTDNTAPVLEMAAAAAREAASDDDSLLASLDEDSRLLAQARNKSQQEEVD